MLFDFVDVMCVFVFIIRCDNGGGGNGVNNDKTMCECIFRNIHNKQSRDKKRKQKVYKIRFFNNNIHFEKKQSTKHHTATTTTTHQRFKINPDNDNNGLFFNNIYFF